MTNEEAVRFCDEYLARNIADIDKEFLKKAKEALQQQRCEDAVSRKFMYELGATCIATRDKNGKLIALGAIEELPPVTPQSKMGHWVDDGQYAEGHSEHACRCSKCGYTYIGYTDKNKDCPNCGAKMQEVKE